MLLWFPFQKEDKAVFDNENRYVIENYQLKPPFSSFLPGIAGPLGVPIWCYYNNRGQAVCSFGARDKDHAIMEFSPAHVAYRDVSRTGFRTFCKIDGEYQELFTHDCHMHIGESELEITSQDGTLEYSVLYFGVPSERTASLARILTVRNTGTSPIKIELIDGMPEVVPYGVDQDTLKNMIQLAKAWMRSEGSESGVTLFGLRASMADTAQVTEVKGRNFCLGWDEEGKLLHPLVQPALVFGEDTSLARAERFAGTPLKQLCGETQVTENCFPCCFLPKEATLETGEEIKIFSIYGQAEEAQMAAALADKVNGAEWFMSKHREAVSLVESLTAAVSTETADHVFDAYCRQTYLDNLLRGGVPSFFEYDGKKTPFYLYSRKHGDPEREYNYFSLGGEYYAQGNGNFRDVNQNRRSDVMFAPELGDANIHTFFDLIQADGYNPLVITATTYTLPAEKTEEILKKVPQSFRSEANELFSKPFTPGALAMAAEDWGMTRKDAAELTAAAVCQSASEPNADFQEGYWCDHWTYNLDLIENYLSVYPEKREELLFGDGSYRWYASKATVNPRSERYVKTADGLRQYNALTLKEDSGEKWVTVKDGSEAHSTLIEKLLLLCAVKTATLDAAGMGVEMEGGKPGWYDALNGLPGLLGSSMAESCELARLLRFTSEALELYGGDVELYEEIAELIINVSNTLDTAEDNYTRWDMLNRVKEDYRRRTNYSFTGKRSSITGVELAGMLKGMETSVLAGIDSAVQIGGGICPTYFSFDAVRVMDTPDGPMPLELEPTPLPFFLEGPVHWLKLSSPASEKRNMTARIKESGLYDEKLKMYKVNDSLNSVSYEVGRTKAFTPGWLENESIWLHMEYKYLLELLKSGLYDEFGEAFRNAAVPFLDPNRYGRSPLENVSFLASSANPDPSVHGRGFVARLSGSTAEFLQMWHLMFFGMKPFRLTKDGLSLEFNPYIPHYLMPENGVVRAAFLGNIAITYDANGCDELVPGKNSVSRWELFYKDGKSRGVDGSSLSDRDARAVRRGEVISIIVTMKRSDNV